MVNEVEVANANAEPGKEYVYTIEHEVNVVNLSQSGCGVNKIEERKTARDWDPRTHEGLVMINSGASVNVCPKWFGNSRMEQSDGVTCFRRANGKPLQEYGKRQIWFKIFGQTKRYDFHVVDVTKPILSVSCLCENGVETHLAKKSFLRFGDGHEPLIRKGGVYFVKAQTVNACVRGDECTEKIHEYNLMGDQKNRAYELTDSQKTDACKLTDSQKKTDGCVPEKTDSQKTDAYKLTDCQKETDAYKLTDSQKADACKLMDSQKTDAYKLTDSQKIARYKLTDCQKTDAYKLMDFLKTREYEVTGAQKKIDACELMDYQKTREYNLKSAQKTDQYELMDSQKNSLVQPEGCTDN